MIQADCVLSTPPTNTSPTRRNVLGKIAATTAAGALIANPVRGMASPSTDAELIALGAQLEPLVEKYYAAKAVWSPALAQAHAEHDGKFGARSERGYRDTSEIEAAWDETCKRLGIDEASDRQTAIWEEMHPIAKAINALPCTSIEGLRAKALVAFWEVSPSCAGNTEFSFEDAFPFQVLFCAVAELCGLMPKIAATGYQLPELFDVSDDDDSDDEEEA